MPSSTKKQARTMAACAHGADIPICDKIPHSVAKEFNEADKRMKNHEGRGYLKVAKTKGGM